MQENLKRRLKRSYSAIKKQLGETDTSAWLSDNFYCIDKYYRASMSDKRMFRYTDFYLTLSKYCESRDYLPTVKTLINWLSSQSKSYSYYELSSARGLLSVCAIIKIASLLNDKKRDYLLPNAIKLLHNLSDPEYDDIVPALWHPERDIAKFEIGYSESDQATKAQYRYLAAKSKKYGEREDDTVKRLIEKAKSQKLPLGALLFKPSKLGSILWMIIAASVFIALSVISFMLIGFLSVLLFIPFGIASGSVADWIISLFIPAYRAPRLELSGVPDNAKTLVTVAALMTGGKGDKAVFDSLERFYFMNPRKNVYYCLLADLHDSDSPYLLEDNAIIEEAHREIDRLNSLYGERFCLFFRERVLNKSEDRYGGWERKRGAVCELVSHIMNGKKSEYYGGDFIRDIRYVLTLDSDTNLSVGSVLELLSVALHPVNKPILCDGRIVSGYGIIQPTVRTELKSAYKTGFSRLISGAGGADVYSSAFFVRSQSLFGSGMFCGKGLIDVRLFHSYVSKKLPEGLILSHDVIEGSILRTLAATDITLTDSTPSNTVSFFKRQHRWLRGDFQNLYFLFGNLLDPFSKCRLLLTALRHLSPFFSLLAVIIGCFFKNSGLALLLLAYSEFLLPSAVSLIGFLLRGSPFACIRFFSKAYSMLTQTLIRLFFEISSGCRKAVLTLNAFVLAVTRLIKRKKTLEWTTAAQTEKLSSSLGKYVLDGATASAIGLLMLIFARPPFLRFLGLLYFVYPLVSLVLSRVLGGGGEVVSTLSERHKKLLTAQAGDMFGFYFDNVGEKTNHLPPDNIQLSPVYDVAMRTSPTNIGFYLVSLLGACDLGLIKREEMCKRLEESIGVIERLEKYRGNLYNWYDISSLNVIGDRYVSAVDSGNLLVMLIALKEGLREYNAESLAKRVEKLISETDLTPFYDKRRALFRIGIRGDGVPDGGCYDMLMSEARMTAYYAVASLTAPKKHWQSLGRTLTHRFGYIGMMSWSGTAFEYLMPQLFLPLYKDSFLYESIAFALMVQREHNDIWGISESGFYAFDGEMHYQYKANGLQTLALRRIGGSENTISPYSTYLSLCIYGETAIKNLKKLENRGMYGKYGLYEALDLNIDSGGICVKSYMAHHVGMSFIACINAIKDNIFVRRFMADKQMASANELLQEKIPIDAHVFEDGFGSYSEKTRPKFQSGEHTEEVDIDSPTAVLLSRGDMNAVITSNGHIGINCGERTVTHTSYDKYSLRFSPIIIFSRSGRNYGCAKLYGGEGFSFEYGSSFVSHIAASKEFSGRVKYSMAKNCNCFIVNTRAEALKKYDITFAFEPVLETERKYLSHITFSRLFVESEYDASKRILYFHRRSGLDGKHIFTVAIAPRDKDSDFCFATSRESLPASSVTHPFDYLKLIPDNAVGACIDPICFAKTRNAEGGRATFLITACTTKRECERNIRLARSDKSEYLSVSQTETRSRVLPDLLYNKATKRVEAFSKSDIGDLWGHGISGDHPFLSVLISEIAINRTEALLQEFISLSNSCIRSELIFITDDTDRYNRPIEASVRECCRNVGAMQYIGRNGGIFILRKSELSDSLLTALKNASAFYIDFSESRVKACASLPYETMPEITDVQNASPLVAPENSLRSGNGYFTENSYTVDKSSLPKAPYSFILTGKRFSSVITQSSLGYTFFDNARERRIASFFGDAKTLDKGERVFALKNGIKYDLCAISSEVIYSKGKAEYIGKFGDIEYVLTVVIPPEYPVKLIRVRYLKALPEKTLFAVTPVMGDRVSGRCIESLGFSIQSNCGLMFKNCFGMTFPDGFGFMGACGGEVDGYDNVVTSQSTDNLFFLGACMSESAANEVIARINKRFFNQAITDSEEFIDSFLPKIRVTTRSRATDVMMNFFLPYQVAACRFYARGSFYQSGGAYGFRDQLQDCLALVYSNPQAVRTHIIRCCAHQYLEGNVMHWWHTRHQNGVNSGVKSKCSDDLLYLPIVVADYIEKTGDISLLDVNVSYLISPPLGESGERYEYPERTEIKESVYCHCLRALAYGERKGKHGLILMGSCDWNDAFSLVGEKGIGESVFSSLLFILSAKAFSGLIKAKGDTATAAHYNEAIDELRKALEEKAFFGDRYARAFCDDGSVLGIDGCGECEIDILSQAFAAMAGLDKSRTKNALTLAFSKLYDRDSRIFKLFSPPFANGNTRVGYIRGYVSGIRENGGQYTHGALWGALGCIAAGLYEEALLILDCVNPASRCCDKELASRYKNEPYAVSADIYSGQHSGRGGWSWYTGAAAWYYRIMLENVLGLRFGANMTILSAKPIIAFAAEIRLGSAEITVSASPEKATPTLNGEPVGFPLTLTAGKYILELPLAE